MASTPMFSGTLGTFEAKDGTEKWTDAVANDLYVMTRSLLPFVRKWKGGLYFHEG
jgi:hypothetical protein